MTNIKEIYGMLARLVEAVEQVRILQKKYEKDGEASTMVRMNEAEKKLDDMVFRFAIWRVKNEKFFK